MDQAQVAVSTGVARPAAISSGVSRGAAVLLGSLLVAVCAHVSIPLLFTPVPVTLQTFAVLLLGLLLSPASAFAALVLYLLEGAAGLPVFSPHGPGGLLQILGPTGGYLLSYPFAAALTSLIARRIGRASFSSYTFSAAVGSLLILALGASWFAVVAHQSVGTALTMTVWLFLPGDALKLCASAGTALGYIRLRSRFRGPSASLTEGAGR
jgi:biotin transport system substrate-specific component